MKIPYEAYIYIWALYRCGHRALDTRCGIGIVRLSSHHSTHTLCAAEGAVGRCGVVLLAPQLLCFTPQLLCFTATMRLDSGGVDTGCSILEWIHSCTPASILECMQWMQCMQGMHSCTPLTVLPYQATPTCCTTAPGPPRDIEHALHIYPPSLPPSLPQRAARLGARHARILLPSHSYRNLVSHPDRIGKEE